MTHIYLLQLDAIGRMGGGALLILLILYFLPTVIAMVRGKPNAGAILVLNLFLGWTFIGWIVALVWAVSANNRTQPVIVNNTVQQTDNRGNVPLAKPSSKPPMQEPQASVINTKTSQQEKINQLRELKQLLDDGILTQEEFNQQKSQVLAL